MLAPEGDHELVELPPGEDGAQEPVFGRFQGHHAGPVEGAAHGLGPGLFAGSRAGAVFPEQAHGIHGRRREAVQGLGQIGRFVDLFGVELTVDEGWDAHGRDLFEKSRRWAVGQAAYGLDHLGVHAVLPGRGAPRSDERRGKKQQAAQQAGGNAGKGRDTGARHGGHCGTVRGR